MYYLCEEYYKPITRQYYIANCFIWVPRVTLLDLRTNWTYKRTLGTELIRMQGTYCIHTDMCVCFFFLTTLFVLENRDRVGTI